MIKQRNEFAGQTVSPKSRETDESRVTAKIYLLGADATTTINWEEDLSGSFGEVLETEYAQI